MESMVFMQKVIFSEKHPGEHGTGDYFWSKNKVDLKKKNEITATTFGWDLIGVHGMVDFIHLSFICHSPLQRSLEPFHKHAKNRRIPCVKQRRKTFA